MNKLSIGIVSILTSTGLMFARDIDWKIFQADHVF